MPPLPSNHIIYATSPEGATLTSLYEPVWFEGKLVIESNQNDLGTAAHRLKPNTIIQ
jgi:hypothetical protein